jgi:hypothetical protein
VVAAASMAEAAVPLAAVDTVAAVVTKSRQH